jgi:ABC-2 type transport system permease protein
MRNVPALLRRELNAYFASVLGYIVMMFFLAVMGVTFAVVVNFLYTGPKQQTAMDFLFRMFWLPSIVVIPAITMRLLSEEKRAGTLEMLMTAPVTDFEVVFAKYLGAVVLYALMWALTGIYVVVLRHFAGPAAQLDLGPVFSGYVGVLLISQFLIAMGLLCSSMTRNQVAAALMSFAIIFTFLIVVRWLMYLFQGGPIDQLLRSIAAFEHMEDFLRGVVDVRPVVLYLSGAIWALFVTTRIVESRKWR